VKQDSPSRPGGLRARQREGTSEAILQAAEEVFCELGLAAPMDRIARQAEVAVGTLYNHFADRDALMQALFAARRTAMLARVREGLAATLDQPFRARLQAIIDAIVIAPPEVLRFRRLLIQQTALPLKAPSSDQLDVLAPLFAQGSCRGRAPPRSARPPAAYPARAALGRRAQGRRRRRVAARGERRDREAVPRRRECTAMSKPAITKSDKWIVALSVTFGTLMGAIDASIVNVALSQIRGTLGASVQEITWISTGFAIATVLVMPLTGFLGRMFGQKRVYLACLALFIVGSGLCGVAWNLPSLVVFRIVQGLGAGALQPTEQAILRQTFPPKEQGMAMALFSMAVMVGPALGPTLGGYIVDNFHWSWIFFINLPVGVLGLLMVTRFVHEPEELKTAMRAEAEKQRKHMDWLGIALLWTTLMALQYVFEEGQSESWFESTEICVLAIIALFSAIAFIIRELTAVVPAVRLSLFKDPVYASSTLTMAAVFSVLMSGMFLLPLFMQELLGFTAMQSGMALMPRTLAMVVAMPLVGKFYGRFPPWLFALAGLLLSAFGQWQLASLNLDSGTAQIVSAIMLQGVGLALVLVPIQTAALSNVPTHLLADAAGLSSLLRQIGGSLGIAVFASQLTRFNEAAREGLRSHVLAQSPEVMARFSALEASFRAHGASVSEAHQAALRSLGAAVAEQGTVIAFDKLFLTGALLFFGVLPMVFLLRRRKDAAPPAHVEVEV
jgi:DHA2 family multidrug resistance protein